VHLPNLCNVLLDQKNKEYVKPGNNLQSASGKHRMVE